MDLETFVDSVESGSFLRDLDLAPCEERPALLRWLRLLDTQTIENWFRSDKKRSEGGYAATPIPGDQQIARLLLRRRLLDLNSRNDPALLNDLWQWLTRGIENDVADVWTTEELAASIAPEHTVARQEKEFGKLLSKKASLLTGIAALEWAQELLLELAKQRQAKAQPARARVVFAWDQSMPDSIRPGVVVDFELRKPASAPNLVHRPKVFCPRFIQEAIEQVSTRVPPFRYLHHDWDFLPDGSLTDTSGTMAIWLAQYLASAGRFEDGYTTLAPWVVVSAATNEDGQLTSVGHLDEKLKLASQSGIRRLISAERNPSGNAQEVQLSAQYGVQLVQLDGQRGVKELARGLHSDECLLEADVQKSDSSPMVDSPRERLQSFRRRQQKVKSRRPYVIPQHFVESLEAAIEKLPGKGYVQLAAPAMMGKSSFIRGLRNRTHDLGFALTYEILYGAGENPRQFLLDILRQAKAVDPDDSTGIGTELESVRAQDKNTCEEVRKELCRALMMLREFFDDEVPVILAIDGIDNVTLRSSVELSWIIPELLPRPDELPEGCYVLITHRTSIRVEVDNILRKLLRDAKLCVSVEVSPDDERYQRVLGEYITQELPEGYTAVSKEIVESLDHSFLWLSLFCELYRDKPFTQFDQTALPLPSAADVFPAYLARIEECVGQERFVSHHVRLICLFTVSLMPLPPSALSRWTGTANMDSILEALDDLRFLLLEDKQRSDSESIYCLGHRSLTEWLIAVHAEPWRSGREAAHASIATSALSSERREGGFHVDRHVEVYEMMCGLRHAVDAKDRELASAWTTHTVKMKLQGVLARWDEEGMCRAQAVFFGTVLYATTELLDRGDTDIAERLAQPADIQMFLARAHTDRGCALHNCGEHAAAIEAFDNAVAILEAEKLLDANAGELLARALALRGHSHHELSQHQEACEDLNQAMVWLKLFGGEIHPHLRRTLARSLLICGEVELDSDIRSAFKNTQQAMKLLQTELKELDQADDHPDWALLLELGTAFMREAEIHESFTEMDENGTDELTQAHERYTNAIALLELLVGAEPTPRILWQHATAYSRRGDVRRELGDVAGEIEDHSHAIAAMEEIRSSGVPNSSLVSLGMEYANRARAYWQTGDAEAAGRDFERASGVMTSVYQSTAPRHLAELLFILDRQYHLLLEVDHPQAVEPGHLAAVYMIETFRRFGKEMFQVNEQDLLVCSCWSLAKPEIVERLAPNDRSVWDHLCRVLGVDRLS